MLRTSNYTIYVPLPDKDELLLVHGYTGAYDRVSRRVAAYLQSCEAQRPKPLYGEWHSEPTFMEDGEPQTISQEIIDRLRRRGYLTELSPEQEEGQFARMVKKLHGRRRANAPSYIIMPTYNCNLRCSYCFQDHMRTKPEYRHLLRRITTTMVDRIYAAFPALEREHGIEPGEAVRRDIGFFGGEPLLAANRQIIEYMIRRVRTLGEATFWAVTNATELEAYEDLLGPETIHYVQITLDGPPAEHDQRRIYADGSGSFEKIAANIDRCLARGVQVHVRMNLDRLNICQVPMLAEEIVARGWDGRAGFSVYTAPIRPGNDKTDVKTTFDMWELDQALDELRANVPAMRVIGRQDDVIEMRARAVFDTRSDPLPEFRTSFCGAHTSMYIFDAFGDIYACWERTGDPRIRIGRVAEDGSVVMHDGMNKLWRSRTVASNPTCRKCRYALHCGGGCAVIAEAQTGRFFSNACDGYAERFRSAVAKAYASWERGEALTYQERVCDL